MIYLDNAATTFPKPLSVRKAVDSAFGYSANPGRAGHKLSIKASEKIYDCRNGLCKFFNCGNPENVILTSGCTVSLNTVIKGVLSKGDHVVISSLEHNSVVRPLEKLNSLGIIAYDVAKVYEGDDDRTIDSFRKLIKDNTKLVVCTHASNVFGVKLPVEKICTLCHFYGVLFCLDVAQTAGVVNINIDEFSPDFVCGAGHKGLYGPMGTGFLIINTENIPSSLCEGGTGSGSSELSQPSMLPDRFESGTQNLTGFAGLSAGIDFVNGKGVDNLLRHELGIVTSIYDKFADMKGIELYTSRPDEYGYVPLLSFNVTDMHSEEVAEYLNKHFDIYVRAGLHCSPLAHRSYNTQDRGTVRICPSAFTGVYASKSIVNAVFSLVKVKKIFI